MLQDDFKITKKIATGGFGTVYKAELDDGKTPGGRPVIIKKVNRQYIHGAEAVIKALFSQPCQSCDLCTCMLDHCNKTL